MTTKKKSTTLTISLPTQLYKGLEAIAREDERSKNYLIGKAVGNYIEDYYFYKKALTALEREDPNYILEKIRKEYNAPKKTNKKDLNLQRVNPKLDCHACGSQ